MQFRLADIAMAMLVFGLILSGIVNNAMSFACASCALICWVENVRLKGNKWLGLAAVIAWIALATSCSLLR